MYIRTPLIGLALAAGLLTSALATGPAEATVAKAVTKTAAKTQCRVDVASVTAGNVDEKDGQDELRFKVGGNLFPHKDFVPMRSGGTRKGSAFGNATTLILNTNGKAIFHLVEVNPPILGSGTELGTAVANGSDCVGLGKGDVKKLSAQGIRGKDKTTYKYLVTLKLTGK